MSNSLPRKINAMITTDSEGNEAVQVVGAGVDQELPQKSWETGFRKAVNSDDKLQVISKAGA